MQFLVTKVGLLSGYSKQSNHESLFLQMGYWLIDPIVFQQVSYYPQQKNALLCSHSTGQNPWFLFVTTAEPMSYSRFSTSAFWVASGPTTPISNRPTYGNESATHCLPAGIPASSICMLIREALTVNAAVEHVVELARSRSGFSPYAKASASPISLIKKISDIYIA